MFKEQLENWKRALEEGGPKISRSEREYIWLGGTGMVVDNKFLMQRLGRVEKAQRVQVGWFNWKRMSEVHCNRKIGEGLKGKIYKIMVRPSLMYGGTACIHLYRGFRKKKMEITEMKMLRWILGRTMRNYVKEYQERRERAGVFIVSTKVQEQRMQWFGHVRNENYVRRRKGLLELRKKRGKGKPRRWKECVAENLREKDLNEDTMDRNECRR
ncbi:uncharacterized protein [Diabrotica undecimpunctata]|uniref:uncharacterized protein n=1 Tax=Diabrotica undecimpunctata TaxID=50387 RepID=UPI003B634EAF